jgi:ribosomal protein S16
VILAKKNQYFETLGWYQPSEFRPKKINFLKQWVGINPVILAKKNQYFETLGWYQPSDFIP